LKNNESIGGVFDGSTMDAQGFLWWALFKGGKIIKINPETKKVVQ